ncbi:MAG: hypothetical protein AB7U63_19720 [Porticoccaceae bacterium]
MALLWMVKRQIKIGSNVPAAFIFLDVSITVARVNPVQKLAYPVAWFVAAFAGALARAATNRFVWVAKGEGIPKLIERYHPR